MTVADPSTHLSVPSHGSQGADDAMAGELGDSLAAIPAAKDVSTKPIAFEFVDRDLSGDEVRGVWVLLGLVVGGWVIGGAAKAKKDE